MKKAISVLVFVLMLCGVQAQQAYWVFLADKQGTTFDPYTYFDAKAIERYHQCGADLYDITNYPLTSQYVDGVNALATGEIGCSRWMNAMGVMATVEQAAAIEALPYVLRVQLIEGNGMTLTCNSDEYGITGISDHATVDGPLEAQLVRMGGKAFRDKGIDGKGIRIAVFDGGFPRVNTHNAFKHLRDNHQIIKTWNFPNNKEDVYGWNSHGLMTLSCIAGRIGDKDLGLATGAEFLLARTEVNTEPFKEEVWWQMAVEWADRNGANIISSSLGYGKERHYTKDMDGTSYVAKAGNLAARKGMLVVNSAGNEADDKQWKTIITPADADSVLCIGGIENSLTEYNHIEFSSYGPSADGRQKPNVCAFGYARTANTPNDQAYHYVHGTSFSCPLVAGFAACAWQASPGKTAMEMFRMIEQSADLYPYCDYSFGYGVPQADYFVGDRKAAEPTFRFVNEETKVCVIPTRAVKHSHLFYSFRRPADKSLAYYGKMDVTYADEGDTIYFTKNHIYNRTLTVHLAGYTDSIRLTKEEYEKISMDMVGAQYWPVVSGDAVTSNLVSRKADLDISSWGSNNTWRFNFYAGIGLPVKTDGVEMPSNFWSPSWSVGFRVLRAFSKVYCLGMSFDFTSTRYRYNGANTANALETQLGVIPTGAGTMFDEVKVRGLEFEEISLEFFQRVRLVPLGIMGNGLHWDLGVYGSIGNNVYTLSGMLPSGGVAESSTIAFTNPASLSDYIWNYGAVTRLTYDWIGIYARYRLNGIGSNPAPGKILLPRLSVGIVLQY